MFLICFSDVINENLRKNLDDNIVFCQDCGEEVKIRSGNTKTIRCEKCQQIADYKPIGKKMVTCIDCGKEFEVDSKANRITDVKNVIYWNERESIKNIIIKTGIKTDQFH